MLEFLALFAFTISGLIGVLLIVWWWADGRDDDDKSETADVPLGPRARRRKIWS